ncbi:hypothetical protein [Candidatus Ichthyocystis hellenicum]|uniref:hypothetical protein n=1 Tax=Candidatus Ichthyocystis hellenicum TaxID=1561003 RepID=UPI000B873EFC|nr:hypothetical protein [Candidatus Ichthyocystis hellenicum]
MHNQIVILIRHFFSCLNTEDIPPGFRRAQVRKHNISVDETRNLILNLSAQDRGFFYLLADKIKDQGKKWWILFEPIHIKVGWNHTSSISGGSLSLSHDDSFGFVQQLSSLDDAHKWVTTNVNRWFCLVDELPDIYAENNPDRTAPSHIINDFETSIAWKKKLTEWEMVLHNSPINKHLADNNLPTINGIKVVASGPIERSWSPPLNNFKHIWTNDHWIRDLCCHQNKKVYPLETHYPEITDDMTGPFLIDDQFTSFPWTEELKKVITYTRKMNPRSIDLHLDAINKSSSISLSLNYLDRYKFWRNNQNCIFQQVNK